MTRTLHWVLALVLAGVALPSKVYAIPPISIFRTPGTEVTRGDKPIKLYKFRMIDQK